MLGHWFPRTLVPRFFGGGTNVLGTNVLGELMSWGTNVLERDDGMLRHIANLLPLKKTALLVFDGFPILRQDS